VTNVTIQVLDGGKGTGEGGRGAPTARPGVPPPPTPIEQPNLGQVLAISSGKGGVGKSTVSANIAAA